jgi:hypothetical protein
VEDEASQVLFEEFVSKLETFMGVKRTEVDFDALWRRTAPVTTELGLEEFFDGTFAKGAHKENAEFLHKFVSDWKVAHEQKPPLLNPQIRYKLSVFDRVHQPSTSC